MEPVELIAQARAAGLELWAEGDRLKVRGPREAESIVAQLREHKPAVLALLGQSDVEVAWRAEAMRRQVPPRGPIPFLLARLNTLATDAPRHCGSCGDPLSEERRYVCAPCQHAKWLVLMETREGA